jgi:tRNA threonylcarbamoyladenosine biosynthesis protein TsaE
MNQKPETSISLITKTADETRQLGRRIGKCLNSPTIIRLVGDLGSGKTCFVQGLARGLEVPDGYEITSPTYTLVHEYPGRLPLIHIDLYRIRDEMDAEAIGLWELMGQSSVVAVEWAERLGHDFWPEVPILNIEFQNTAEQTRHLRLFGCGLQVSDLIRETGTL